ncbi:PCYCGC domain-containing protein [Ectobacillus ponti]|uniref:PCYCGC domain-containing protein n=1 Tax=Ectobacillus ponti TaxID=2961894 RepID=A0AA41XCK3_9BACI|nr:PCYCGC domain-containing protein [Ectobacillus ponti]MCP8969586.1 PCYCGC domain-containing protein [Ectobacillus ponti]
MYRTAIALLLGFLLVLAGCGAKEETKTTGAASPQHEAHEQTGDLAETTKDIHTLPSFLSSYPKEVQQVYMVAGQNHELLNWIPCYCGCGESVGHRSNKNCFIREVKANGEVVWDSHATTCVNCMEIALESASMKQDGKSALEIRKYIDNKYKEGFAKPTPTPMPAN